MYILMWTSARSWQFVIVFVSNLTFSLPFSYDKKKNQWKHCPCPYSSVYVCTYRNFFSLWHMHIIVERRKWIDERRKKKEVNESSFHMITFWLGDRTLWTLIVKVRENEQENDSMIIVILSCLSDLWRLVGMLFGMLLP